MQTPEEAALSFTGECERAGLGLCANHKSPLGAAKTCLHVLQLTELIREREAEVATKALRVAQSDIKARIKSMTAYGAEETYISALHDAWSLLNNRVRDIEREAGAS